MVKITHAEEIHADLGGDGFLLVIPTSVAPRYGKPPAGYLYREVDSSEAPP